MRLRKITDPRPIAADQCHLLGAAPAFDPAFCGEGFVTGGECLGPHQNDGPACVGVAWQLAALVLRDAAFRIVGVADVEGAVGTVQHVGRERHGPESRRKGWASTSSARTGLGWYL